LHVVVIGAGLAGCEAAWQAAQRGLDVSLVEMKPEERSPAHHSDAFAELVCSNSLRSNRVTSAVGLLKQEMRALGSLVIQAADEAAVPAGQALAVDRDLFAPHGRRSGRRAPAHPRGRAPLLLRCAFADRLRRLDRHGDRVSRLALRGWSR
jgi:methylenetetrahydrofolate--tRNA-(uracil-5-)-methyltransferase